MIFHWKYNKINIHDFEEIYYAMHSWTRKQVDDLSAQNNVWNSSMSMQNLDKPSK